jgi:hypothetical protein
MSSHDIIAILARYRQRATYGALAGIVGGLPRSVMSGLPKTPENSWIVAAASGLPTGYSAHELDAELQSRSNVISTADELLAWLRSPR